MNELTDLRNKLQQRLEHITTENGFYTDAGKNVRIGWFEEIIDGNTEQGPVIVIQPGKNAPPVINAGELVLSPGFLIVGAINSGFTEYEAALDDLEHDIYSALVKKGVRNIDWAPFGTYQLSFGEPLDAPPGGGQRMASVAIPINFKIIINRHEA